MKLTHTLLTALLALTCTVASAQWQWLDKDGRKVFSDRAPPTDIPEKSILKRPNGRMPSAPAADAASTEPQAAAPAANADKGADKGADKNAGIDKELEAKKKKAADDEAAKRKEEEARYTKAKIESCARAKQAKTTYDSGVRISQVNAKGEREVMDEKARADELKRIQGIIASDCK